jgi:preprotein translocase subunit SecE
VVGRCPANLNQKPGPAAVRLKIKLTMNKITTYFQESYKELLEKVTWPTWSQLQQATVIVLVATILITFIVWIMDTVSSAVLHLIYSFL